MKIINRELLKSFSARGDCEWCRRRGPTDPHHLFGRGLGGGRRLDVRINLISLCRRCHDAHHAGKEPQRFDLLAIVARREKCLQDDIVAEIMRLRDLPKEAASD